MSGPEPCVFCREPGGEVLVDLGLVRVVLADEPGTPGFCRVIANRHVREMTDLGTEDRRVVMDAVFAVEAALRQVLHPQKMNLASLGNLVPHLHWHIIPRYADDAHFPNPVWGAKVREAAPRVAPPDLACRLRTELHQLLAGG